MSNAEHGHFLAKRLDAEKVFPSLSAQRGITMLIDERRTLEARRKSKMEPGSAKAAIRFFWPI